jgi:hypothetical protein
VLGDGGEIITQNFYRFPVMRMQSVPQIDVLLIDSGESPTGVGEVSVPTAAPALVNAIAAATGDPDPPASHREDHAGPLSTARPGQAGTPGPVWASACVGAAPRAGDGVPGCRSGPLRIRAPQMTAPQAKIPAVHQNAVV